MSCEQEIKGLVSEIVGVSAEELLPDASFMDDLGMDSLRALEILAAIENKYGITIEPERLQEMTTLNNVIKVSMEYIPSVRAE
ncbi:acyl carrier protein [Ruminiclostridium cellobioparum]|jgi:acyl carrier protein|uniref:acyl carrier protein n=1 Tax=Ruminiclostridium cellobioparum TaxID=29355 RepID=UPI00048941B7|nr:acyl carrier protein [Ruminiclostridium cellobioparum]